MLSRWSILVEMYIGRSDVQESNNLDPFNERWPAAFLVKVDKRGKH